MKNIKKIKRQNDAKKTATQQTLENLAKNGKNAVTGCPQL